MSVNVSHGEIAVFAFAAVVLLLVLLVLSRSLKMIGPSEVGLVNKRLGKKLTNDDPVAFNRESGYQAKLLMPGLRFKLWPVHSVSKHPWVQVPAGEIGVVISQVGAPPLIGAKSAVYKPEFGNFSDLRSFLDGGGQKGVQRPVLPPGTLVPLHPVAFLALTASRSYGVPVSSSFRGELGPSAFGLSPEQLQVTVIQPRGGTDVIGIVTALDGDPLPPGDIASRIGGFDDVLEAEHSGQSTAAISELTTGSKNQTHNNYQDFQAFIDHGGKIGLQHDPLLYGSYLLNPFLISVELVPMLVVSQGQVAVIKAFVGQPTEDTSGETFKFGAIVRPGHRGIWMEPLRTGKYALNPRCYSAEIVPTSILTLNWATATSAAHSLDSNLSSIDGKSREGFVFRIDLQVQIHVPDTQAPRVISMVGTMQNLVSEVLQSAVGNYFRNSLQRLPAVEFIETRDQVQEKAQTYITDYLARYQVETKGVYIQDVIFPSELVTVLTQREIANQEKTTFQEQQSAQKVRIELEAAKGTADMQGDLAKAQVSISIKEAQASARKAEAEGEAAFTERTGQGQAARDRAIGLAQAEVLERTGAAQASKDRAIGLAGAEVLEKTGLAQAEVTRAVGEAEATKTKAVGLAQAEATEAIGRARALAFSEQAAAIGQGGTTAIAVTQAIADGGVNVMPKVLVTGGGTLDGLAATLIDTLTTRTELKPESSGEPLAPPAPLTQ